MKFTRSQVKAWKEQVANLVKLLFRNVLNKIFFPTKLFKLHPIKRKKVVISVSLASFILLFIMLMIICLRSSRAKNIFTVAIELKKAKIWEAFVDYKRNGAYG